MGWGGEKADGATVPEILGSFLNSTFCPPAAPRPRPLTDIPEGPSFRTHRDVSVARPLKKSFFFFFSNQCKNILQYRADLIKKGKGCLKYAKKKN